MEAINVSNRNNNSNMKISDNNYSAKKEVHFKDADGQDYFPSSPDFKSMKEESM